MRTLGNGRRHQCLAIVGIFLVMAILIAWMPGCGATPIQYELTITSTEGGSATNPGEGTFSYNQGTVVTLVAEAEEGCTFINWSGDVGTIGNVNAPQTIITTNGDYSITANFDACACAGGPIYDWYDLDAIRNCLAGNHTLMNDLDSVTAGYEDLAGPTANEGKGWLPIGTYEEPFVGLFEGQGYEIGDLFINRTDPYEDGDEYVGLFGLVYAGAIIQNVGVMNFDITGGWKVGGLAGGNYGLVSDTYSTGNVSGIEQVGGLMGSNGGTISNSYSTGNVNDGELMGGLIGGNGGNITNSYSTCTVTGYNLYECDPVVGGYEYVGGLVGHHGGTISKCYATGSVVGGFYVGGLVGRSGGSGNVSNSYSTGSVTGCWYVGGLVGELWDGPTVSDSYSTGSVSGTDYVGGLVGRSGDEGYCEGIVINSFWDTQTSGQGTSAGGVGKTTTQMQDIATFSGATWDITSVEEADDRDTYYIWNIVDEETYPFLSWQPV